MHIALICMLRTAAAGRRNLRHIRASSAMPKRASSRRCSARPVRRSAPGSYGLGGLEPGGLVTVVRSGHLVACGAWSPRLRGAGSRSSA
jgi:hypothetical protein